MKWNPKKRSNPADFHQRCALFFSECCNTVNRVLGLWKAEIGNNEGTQWRAFLERHHISLWVTASSVFKARLPSEAWATNCTSQAGQDGTRRAAPPLISAPSAANQTHHVAAFCLPKAAGAKKVNSSRTGRHRIGKQNESERKKRQDNFSRVAPCLCFRSGFTGGETGVNHSERSLPPGATWAASLSPGQPWQLCLLLLLPLPLPLASGRLHHLSVLRKLSRSAKTPPT